MLKQGQVVRIGNILFHVDYVNECRAKCSPLSSRDQPAIDRIGGRDMNISPNSHVEIVSDIAATKHAIELAAAERELRQAKRDISNDQYELEEAERELELLKRAVANAATAPAKPSKPAPTRANAPQRASNGTGWFPGPKPAPEYRAGSLAATVMDFIHANPGLSTAEISAAIPEAKHVPSCVSRFNQAGLIEKR